MDSTHSPALDGTKAHLASSSKERSLLLKYFVPGAGSSQGLRNSATSVRLHSPPAHSHKLYTGGMGVPRVLLPASHLHWHKDSYLTLEVLYNGPPQVCLVLCSDHLTATHLHGSEHGCSFTEAFGGGQCHKPCLKVGDRGKSSPKVNPQQGHPFLY